MKADAQHAARQRHRGLSLPRMLHMASFGNAHIGPVVEAEKQIQRLVRQMRQKIARHQVAHNPRWLAPSLTEVSEICAAARARAALQTPASAAATAGGSRGHKMALFLVPRVPLVFQQAEAIRANTTLDVGEYCGDDNSDHTNRMAWLEEFASRDVLVMTPQIMLNVLRHGFTSLSHFKLIILDECHHATNLHPYNLLMQEFYWALPKGERPIVFGTASIIIAIVIQRYSKRTGIYHTIDQFCWS